jgi:ubiquinol-cytochrome c reductase cytochrome c subunit
MKRVAARRLPMLALLFALVAPARADDAARGRSLYLQGCISCHGPQLAGVTVGAHARGAGGVRGAGPQLAGVGAQAADLYLSTGYMPLHDPNDQPLRKTPLRYSEDDIRALVAYIGSFGGPPIPRPHPERGSQQQGLRLFTENCAGCHQMNLQGGIVPGAIAPELLHATPTQIAEAVRVGPYLMPRFTRAQLTNQELDSVIAYVERAKHPVDRGGWGIGHLGPIPEGLVAWLVAGVVLIGLARVIGERSRS